MEGLDVPVWCGMHLHGRDLRKRRLFLGLTQRKLAERLGMTRNTITRYERGFLPTIQKYVQLAVTALQAESRPARERR